MSTTQHNGEVSLIVHLGSESKAKLRALAGRERVPMVEWIRRRIEEQESKLQRAGITWQATKGDFTRG